MKERLLTGDRATGSTFPIAAYVGTLKNRIERQEDYDTFIFIADYHALTTHFDNVSQIKENSLGLMKTYLSLGLDPEYVTFYRQSRIPQIYRLHVILSMLTKMPELERQPMLKEKLGLGYKLTYGLMGYPILMASDILIMNSDLVPVGKDNEANVEIASDLAIRFNSIYGKVFNIPKGLIGDVVVGLDGQGKSGKSTGGIYFTDDTATVKKKIMSMYTDPNRIHPNDPGKVEGNPVFIYHDYFNTNLEEVADLKERYQKGTVGDVEVKTKLFEAIEEFLKPIRAKRAEIDAKGDQFIIDILEKGEKNAQKVASETEAKILSAMGF
ncbi:MAG: Tryptophan-tRNA ligase [candidate division WS6 bacterium GW2011_GWC1_36_11]|uniref:Tryptophan--tRNA ligase n=3 Tax=Candidatus Dojkabacteria TaxID=74243 RepID=A0A0G0FZH3_9BACT|nr:MAG: Tryptophan-tRNA ligase [candidate division WS6 bacterium GW2011_GWC1_36_11]KKQ04614.1 MAG: Tryptophan-tRNA ligase [candidate division WS6 bacterium GW2011_WS6_36_26]KKQ11001.1 MAG: Tryptophan-tRNA ligase [candidate division WS6 bacterium GW2011_GWE1_36_69]KKQ11954.1 MAG: Tryptophan-tRNA ligase [candidate division WS6 bacterium GW2011_GWC2_36_7]KKQ17859.1 MAG: Tryptophan-tRNA ligase [candidate division WS6 bacterium GW2011_GWF1_36_8]